MKYYIRQKIFSFKDAFTIKNEQGDDIYKVEGKLFSFQNKLELKDMTDTVLYHAKKKVFSFLGHYYIYDVNDNLVSDIKRKFSLRPKLDVQMGNTQLLVEGRLFAHSFQVFQEGQAIASISKKVLSFGDSYEIDVMETENKELIMFIVVIIDQMMHEKRSRGANH